MKQITITIEDADDGKSQNVEMQSVNIKTIEMLGLLRYLEKRVWLQMMQGTKEEKETVTYTWEPPENSKQEKTKKKTPKK